MTNNILNHANRRNSTLSIFKLSKGVEICVRAFVVGDSYNSAVTAILEII